MGEEEERKLTLGRVLWILLLTAIPVGLSWVSSSASSAMHVRVWGYDWLIWYESLRRAPWTPPNITFAIVWPILYAFYGLALALLKKGRRRWLCILLWLPLLIGLLAWPFVFNAHALRASLALLLLCWAVSAILVPLFAWNNVWSAFLVLPLFLWLTFAATLDIYLVLYNAANPLMQ